MVIVTCVLQCFRLAPSKVPNRACVALLMWEWKQIKFLESCFVNILYITGQWERHFCPCAYPTKHCAMKTYGWVAVLTHVFYTSAEVRGEGSASQPGRFNPEKRAPSAIWKAGWAPQPVWAILEKSQFLILSGFELQYLGLPTRSSRCYLQIPCMSNNATILRAISGHFTQFD
jgi:hypothetical protein